VRSGRYGSSATGSRGGRKTTGFNKTTVTAEGDSSGGGGKGDFSRSFNFGLGSRAAKGSQSQTDSRAPWNDEVELVSNAQGRSTHGSETDAEEEELHAKGIMRRTEVTHVVTYAVRKEEEEEDRSSRKS